MRRLLIGLLLAAVLPGCTSQPTISSTFEDCSWWYGRGHADHARCVKTRLLASYAGSHEYDAMAAFSDRYIEIGKAMDDGRISDRRAQVVLLEEWLGTQRALNDARQARDAQTTRLMRAFLAAAVVGF